MKNLLSKFTSLFKKKEEPSKPASVKSSDTASLHSFQPSFTTSTRAIISPSVYSGIPVGEEVGEIVASNAETVVEECQEEKESVESGESTGDQQENDSQSV